MANRDNFSKKVKDQLAKRAGNCCSYPDCLRSTGGPSTKADDAVSNTGIACHITAASPGGMRYDSSTKKRKAFDNGIWMCQIHAKIIDEDDIEHTVATLKEWKRNAETRAGYRQKYGKDLHTFTQWRFKVNTRLKKDFMDRAASRAHLGQVIDLEEATYVPRKQLNQNLTDWWEKAPKSDKGMVILGPEGHGKTWGVAHWIDCLLAKDNAPAVLFVGSITDLSTAINPPALLQAASHGVVCPNWNDWSEGPVPEYPEILIIFDGLNEKPGVPWQRILASLQLDPWSKSIAWIVTRRKLDWNCDLKIDTFELPTFDEGELESALAKHKLNLEDMPPFVVKSKIIRIPRLFDLVLKRRKTLEESGDMTVERLVYEEMKDLLVRKDPDAMGFSDVEYKEYLINLAEKMGPTYQKLEAKDLPLPFIETDKSKKILADLISRGVMTKTRGRYKVDKDRMMLGYGLLLVERCIVDEEDGKCPIKFVYSFFEPLNDIDLKRDIVGMAAYHSLVTQNVSRTVRMALFQVWMEARNWDSHQIESFAAYFVMEPLFYFDFFESGNGHDFYGLARYVLIKHKDHAQSAERYAQRFEKWCGFVDATGCFGIMGGVQEKTKEEYQQKLRELLNMPIQPGSFDILGYTLRLTEKRSDMKLAEVALEVISYMDRTLFIRCLVIAALANRITKHSNWKLLCWVIRASACDLEPVLRPIIKELSDSGQSFPTCAASSLLSNLGSESSFIESNRLPKDLQNPFKYWRPDPDEDRCLSGFNWSEADCVQCAGRSDLWIGYIAQKLKDRSLNPEFKFPRAGIERLGPAVEEIDVAELWHSSSTTSAMRDLQTLTPLLAHYAPEVYQSLVERVMIHAADLEGDALSAWACRSLRDNALLLDAKHQELLTAKWRCILDTLSKEGDGKNSDTKFAEDTLFTEILALEPDGQKQLALLLERPSQAFFSTDLPAYLNPIVADLADSLLLNLLQQETLLHRLEAILVFCYANPVGFSLHLLETIFKKAMSHPELTYFGFSILARCENEKAKQYLVENVLASGEQKPHWDGSLLLSCYGTSLSSEELFRRLDPKFCGLAVAYRKRPEDLKLFIRYIEAQIKKGHCSLDTDAGLLEAFQTQPSLIDRLIEKLNQNSRIMFDLAQCPFLVKAAIEADFERGLKLFEALKAQNPCGPELLCFPFSIKATHQKLNQLKVTLLKEATLDFQLLEYATKAQEAGHQNWLWQEAAKLLKSEVPFEHARGVAILGFFHDYQPAKAELERLTKGPQSWYQEIATWSMKQYLRNQWAHHWFTQFVQATGKEAVWAGFTLFLATLDSRFVLWKAPLLQKLRGDKGRYAFFYRSKQKIKQAIEKCEKPLKETLFGDEITKDQLSLWRRNVGRFN